MASFRAFGGMLPFESRRPVRFAVAFCLFSSFVGLFCRSVGASFHSLSWPSVSSCSISRSFVESSSVRLLAPSVSPLFLATLPRRSEFRSRVKSVGHLRLPCPTADTTYPSAARGGYYRCLSCSDNSSFFRLSPFVSRASSLSYAGRPLLLAHQSLALINASFTCMLPLETTATGSPVTPSLVPRGRNAALRNSHVTYMQRPAKGRRDTIMIRSTLVRLLSAARSTRLPAGNAGKGPVSLEIEKKLTEAFQPTTLSVIDETLLHAGHEATQGLRSSETHFRIYIASPQFKDLSLVQRHRKIYTILQKEIDEGIHALSIHAEAASPEP